MCAQHILHMPLPISGASAHSHPPGPVRRCICDVASAAHGCISATEFQFELQRPFQLEKVAAPACTTQHAMVHPTSNWVLHGTAVSVQIPRLDACDLCRGLTRTS